MLDVSRKELKYLVSIADVLRTKRILSYMMKEDEHNGLDGYKVRSLYFDTLSDSDFTDKLDGYDQRQKIRLRVYQTNADMAKLELKEKTGSNQRKRSLAVSRKEAEMLIRGDYSCLLERSELLARWLYTFMTTRLYRPKCIVEYDRVAYYLPTNDIRVTFDQNLRATEANFDLFDENLILYPVSERTEVTMEVKYNGFFFTHVKEVISKCNKMQVSNSKYCRARMISKKTY